MVNLFLITSIGVVAGGSLYLARRIWKKEGVGDATKKGLRQAKSGVKKLGETIYEAGVAKAAQSIKGEPCTWDMSVPPAWVSKKRQPDGIFYYWHDGSDLTGTRKKDGRIKLPEGYIASWYWMRQPPKQAYENYQKEGITTDGLPVFLSTDIYYALYMGDSDEDKVDDNLKLLWDENGAKHYGVDYVGSIENIWDMISEFADEETDEGEEEIDEQEQVLAAAPA